MTRTKLFSLTAADFKWDYYNGTGNGGQNRNKTQSCVRCFHEPSGAMGQCEEERSQVANKQRAFKRCVESKEFKKWHKLEAAMRMGVQASVETMLHAEMLKTRVDTKDENGRWVKEKEHQVTEQDVKNLEEEFKYNKSDD